MSNPSQLGSIRNPEGIWINTSVFQEPANHFRKYGYYCGEPMGTPLWREYWTTQLKYCQEGYVSGGVKITGHHYFYLNFIRIMKVKMLSGSVGKKIKDFPDFWDGDYNYFWMLEIARYGAEHFMPKIDTSLATLDTSMAGLIAPPPTGQDFINGLKLEVRPTTIDGGKHMIVGKARRKGYSYKNGAICANIYNSIPDSLTILGAFDKKYLYPKGTMGMASSYLDYLNEHTGWGKKREYVDRQEHRKASFIKFIEGKKVESGYQSEIMALSFGDNPDAARGKDATLLLFEEAGVFPNLQASFQATAPGLKAGRFITGQIVIFGTGGDMESGTADFANMFYNPDLFGLMQFENIWDENVENTTCGFFHPFFWNMEGYYDEQGNSDQKEALAWDETIRDNLKKSQAGSKVLQQRVQEEPRNPSEAFLTVSMNIFPTPELRARLNKLRATGGEESGIPIYLWEEEGKVRYKPDLENDLKPIWTKVSTTEDKRGCVVMFEAPIPNAPRGLYKLGYDPVRQDNGSSYGAIYVYKGTHKGSMSYRENIVAVYYGRAEESDDMNRIFELLIKLYNSPGMHENEVTNVKNYFRRRHLLHLLAYQPDAVIKANVKNSNVKRVYGCHMDEKMKNAGEIYIKDWLLRILDYDENDRPITIIDYIDDVGLLEELIMYNRKGNFDRVMALMQVMFQCQEEELGTDYGDTDTDEERAKEFEDFETSLFN